MAIIYIHAAFALLAIPLGLFIFLNKKGTTKHKVFGRVWVLCLVIVSLSAIFIQTIKLEQYSLIHLLIPFTLGSLIHSIWSIKQFQKTKDEKYKYAHQSSIIGVYIGALLVAGILTLLPGRFFHEILFG